MDLLKFCRDVPPGEGRIFSCLVAASKERNLYLEPECHRILLDRMEMFGKAVKVSSLLFGFKNFFKIIISRLLQSTVRKPCMRVSLNLHTETSFLASSLSSLESSLCLVSVLAGSPSG